MSSGSSNVICMVTSFNPLSQSSAVSAMPT
jgi:hypothetical protein